MARNGLLLGVECEDILFRSSVSQRRIDICRPDSMLSTPVETAAFRYFVKWRLYLSRACIFQIALTQKLFRELFAE